MNKKIHKLSEGAMYLAILGALMVINRLLSSVFDIYVPIVCSIVLIIYTSKYGVSDGLIMAVGAFFLTFLFGNIYLLLFNTIGTLAGITYGYGVKKGIDYRIMLIASIVVFIIGEFIFSIVLLPLFGYEDLDSVFETVRNVTSVFGLTVSDGLLNVIYGLSLVLTGILEGLLVHLLAIVTLKRLNIKVVTSISLDKLKLKPIYAYILFILFFIMVYITNLSIDTNIAYFFICAGLISAIILAAQGYIFCLVYGMIVLQRNITFYLILLIVLFVPLSIVMLIIFGFLYASGPLDRYLKKKREG